MAIRGNTNGILPCPLRTYLRPEDVSLLIGCKRTKAYAYIREVNAVAEKEGLVSQNGQANKYLFAKMHGLPISDIDAVLKYNMSKKEEKNG